MFPGRLLIRRNGPQSLGCRVCASIAHSLQAGGSGHLVNEDEGHGTSLSTPALSPWCPLTYPIGRMLQGARLKPADPHRGAAGVGGTGLKPGLGDERPAVAVTRHSHEGQCVNRPSISLCLNRRRFSRLRFLGDNRILPISTFTPRLSSDLQDRPSPWPPPASMWEPSPCRVPPAFPGRRQGDGTHHWLPAPSPTSAPMAPRPRVPCFSTTLSVAITMSSSCQPEGSEGPPGSSGHG